MHAGFGCSINDFFGINITKAGNIFGNRTLELLDILRQITQMWS